MGAVALFVPAATVAGLTAAGLGPLPRADARVVEVASATPTPTADLRVRPAQQVVDAILASPPAGWLPQGDAVRAAVDAVASSCDAPVPAGVVQAVRRYDVGTDRLAVTVAAYGAGDGAVAVQDWLAALQSCDGANVAASSIVPGVDAFVAWRTGGVEPAVSTLVWRRGDVLVGLAVDRADPSGLAVRARDLDAVVLTALRGRCAAVASTLADASRSPWIHDVTFTGLTVAVPVVQPPLPDPGGVVPTAPLSPSPSISYPAQPVEPIWPSSLPTPVGEPLPPSDPGPQPSATSVPSRAADPTGPGCGWAFTGQPAPAYDAADEKAVADARVDDARQLLLAAQEQWQQDVTSYRAGAQLYTDQLAAFLVYAEQVRQVAAAWDGITAARDAYARDLVAYQDALLALQVFETDRAAAQAAYDAAFSLCYSTSPTATPDPSATATDSVTPDPSTTPSPGDTGSPSRSGPAGCPPEVPAILLQPTPTVPPSPLPPPDPRPSAP